MKNFYIINISILLTILKKLKLSFFFMSLALFIITTVASANNQYNYIVMDPLRGNDLASGINHDFWEPWNPPGGTEAGYFSISNDGLVLGSFSVYLGILPGPQLTKWALAGDFRVSFFFESSPNPGGYGNRVSVNIYETVPDEGGQQCRGLVYPDGFGGLWTGYAAPESYTYFDPGYGAAAFFLFVKAGNTLSIYRGNTSPVTEDLAHRVFFGSYLNPTGKYLFMLGTGNPNSGWIRVRDVVIETQDLVACDAVTPIPVEWLRNTIPTANAGVNITISGEQQVNTIIQGTATDSEGGTLTYRWLEGSIILQDWTNITSNSEASLDLSSLPPFSIGTHHLVLEVSDGKSTVTDEMILTVGNSAPHAAPSGGGTYQVNASVVIGGQVSDFDGDLLSYEWLEGENSLFSGTIQAQSDGNAVDLPPEIINNLDLGVHTLTLRVNDGINPPVSGSITVEIIDTFAPILAPVADKAILWPPNHKMVPVTIFANASDDSGGPVTLSVSVASNELQEGLGDGNTPQDWTTPINNNGIITLQLRAERSGKGSGRIYTVTIVATDWAGNASIAKVDILVPHDKGK
ncbi:MAG: hypothetical protein HY787_04790 [Deltaproteobacteria bacterium]|nr:hypothetical protein [Deltaproteobacteria bacterium]